MSFCRKCGCQLRDGSKFCHQCGTQVILPSGTAANPPRSPQTQQARIQQPQQARVQQPQQARIQQPQQARVQQPQQTRIQQPQQARIQQPQQARVPQPQPGRTPQPNRAPQPQKPKKHTTRRFISVVLVISLLFTAFIKPGFLIKKPGKTGKDPVSTLSGGKPSSNTGLNAADTEEEIILNYNTAPSHPGFMQVKVTEADIQNASSESIPVSVDAPIVFSDDVFVAFHPWDIEDSGDECIIRHLGERTDSNSDVTLNIYDFSLASGITEFSTGVDIYLPRPQDGSAAGVYYYNPDTSAWEPTYYDISEDGGTYILHTNHFSTYSVKRDAVIRKYYDKGSHVDISMPGVFYADLSNNGSLDVRELITRPIEVDDEKLGQLFRRRISDGDLDKLLGSNFSDNLMVPTAFADISGYAGHTDALVGALGFIQKIGDKTGPFSKHFAIMNVGLYAAKVSYMAFTNKSFSTIVKNSWVDFVSSGFSTVGAIAVGTGNVPVATFCTVCGLAIYGTNQLIDYAITSQSYVPGEEVYKYYLNNLVTYGIKPLQPNGKGWPEYLEQVFSQNDDFSVIEKEIDRRVTDYCEGFWKLSPEERQAVYDRYNGITIESKSNKNRKMYVEPSAYDQQLMVAFMKDTVYSSLGEVVGAMYTQRLTQVVESYKKAFYDGVYPVFNYELVINVIDDSLEKDQTFAQSYLGNDTITQTGNSDPYMDPGMRFLNMKCLFKPLNIKEPEKVFNSRTFRPTKRDNSNTVFHSRYFYYLAMGAPNRIAFSGIEALGIDPVNIPLTFPQPLICDTAVELHVNSGEQMQGDISDFLGQWYGTYDTWIERAHVSLAMKGKKLQFVFTMQGKDGEIRYETEDYNYNPSSGTLEFEVFEGIGPMKRKVLQIAIEKNRDGTLWFDMTNVIESESYSRKLHRVEDDDPSVFETSPGYVGLPSYDQSAVIPK